MCIILTNPRKNLFLKKAPQHPNVLMSRISAPSVVMTYTSDAMSLKASLFSRNLARLSSPKSNHSPTPIIAIATSLKNHKHQTWDVI